MVTNNMRWSIHNSTHLVVAVVFWKEISVSKSLKSSSLRSALFWILALWEIIGKIFCHSVCCFFILSIDSLLCRSILVWPNPICWTLQLFLVWMRLSLGKPFPTPMSSTVLPILSFRRFNLSVLMFIYLIHFTLI